MVATTIVVLVLSQWWTVGISAFVVAPITAYLLWFVLSEHSRTHTTHWVSRVAGLGAVQLCGVAFAAVIATFQRNAWAWPFVGLAALAIGAAVVATGHAHRTLYGEPAGRATPRPTTPAGPDPATLAATAPGLLIEHRMKSHGTLGDCRVSMDGHALRWRLRLSRSMIKVTMGSGQIPLTHITGVRIAQVEKGAGTRLNNFPVLPGPVVAVATPQGEACFAAVDPQLLAAQLQSRLHALGLPVWPR
ncbi:hypothetical protein FB384_001439 [Prauserella sediminis]|uniref:Uncharacterized protein n=1 Tax=Prauserella sediminis TaxID=577680 RepID=A0A839XRL7_9PSEU|nr:hypothetical protein [Prauserella sediminis]MBB3662535.1 hypothetical protein [Prauserella sediminis]